MSSSPQGPESPESRRHKAREKAVAALADALGRLRYGAIQVTVHDGQVVQMDVTERQRFS